jgi:hypothetical protein
LCQFATLFVRLGGQSGGQLSTWPPLRRGHAKLTSGS